MVGVLASLKAPELFSKLILVGPSPRYIDDEDYIGGFGAAQIEELLEFLADNPMGWSQAMAPAIMGNPDRPELGEELTQSFCRTDPVIAKEFARATFTSDNRADLDRVTIPTLILQCSDDIIAPLQVGQYVHAHIPGSQLVVLEATGHCPNLSAPAEVIAAIRAYV
jgi:sigma-B regulation protein RsbQ